MDRRIMDEFAAAIKRVEDEAYARGKADAKKDLLAYLSTQAPSVKPVAPQPEKTETAERNKPRILTPAKARERAPKGIVPALVSRVLSKHSDLTPKEILAHAETEFERMIKPPSLRSELRNGRTEGRYHSEFGRWSLANTKNEEAEGRALPDQPSASNANQGGLDETALDLSGDFDL